MLNNNLDLNVIPKRIQESVSSIAQDDAFEYEFHPPNDETLDQETESDQVILYFKKGVEYMQNTLDWAKGKIEEAERDLVYKEFLASFNVASPFIRLKGSYHLSGAIKGDMDPGLASTLLV